jgi:hypothetical protein
MEFFDNTEDQPEINIFAYGNYSREDTIKRVLEDF